MLDCRIHGACDLRVVEVARPEPAPGEVLVRLGAAGICGSDMHYFLHGAVGAFRIREPLTPGHEASGTIEALGEGVSAGQEGAPLAVGTRVAIDPSRPCGRCQACRGGRENLCRDMRFLGSASVFPHMQGMFREFFLMPAAQCVPVADTVPLAELAMSEPLAVALHSVQRAGPLMGARVLVVGAGTIGCLIGLASRLGGAAHVTVIDVVDHPLAVARQIGIDRALRADGPDPLFAADDEFDVVFEASGAAAGLRTALLAARRGAVIVQVGTLPADGLHLQANLIMQKELDLRGSFRFGNVFRQAVHAISTRRIDVRPLVSASYPLERAQEAIERACDKTRSIKVQLEGGRLAA